MSRTVVANVNNMADTNNIGVGCTVCGVKSGLKRCGICKCTYYCSRQHQIEDWTAHKVECHKLKEIDGSETAKGEDKNESAERENTENQRTASNNIKHDGSGNVVNHEVDGIPFDTRSIKTETFIQMSAKVNEITIAKVAVENLNEKGLCVIDGLFSRSQIKKALKDIMKCTEENLFQSGKLEGGRTSSDQDKQVVNANIRSDKILWLEGTESGFPGITNVVKRMDSILWEFNQFLKGKYFINGRTKAMVACYPGNGAFYRRHVDNPSGDGRVVTCILYLNERWNVHEDGGLLRILPSGTDDYIDVAPLANRLLFFWCDKRNPHEVHPAYKTRYAITVWYMDEDERKRAKQESLIDEMAKVRGELVLNECKEREQERDKVNQQIEDAASQAIASLSMEELTAMSKLISGQPEAHEILANMGISAGIRTKLLDKLQHISTDS